LDEAENAKEQAKQDGYDVGVVETKEALRAEVLETCKFYCFQVWNEALDQAGVEAFSALRRAENVYHPSAIRVLGSSGSKADSVSKEANEGKESPTKALPTANISPEAAKQSKDAKMVADTTKEVAHDAHLPPAAPKDPFKEKEASHNMEIVLATLPIPSKEDLKGEGPTSTTTASTQPPKTQKDKLVIKMKP